MTKYYQDFIYNIDSSNFTELKDTCINIRCTDGLTNETGSKCISITRDGTKPDSASGIIYVVVVLISFITFIGMVLFSISTDRKYLKVGFGLFSYIIFTWILFILWQLSYNYLNVQGLTNILRLFFNITTIALFPVFLLCIFITIKEIYDDIAIKKVLERGLNPYEK
jgi:hypothetical protein